MSHRYQGQMVKRMRQERRVRERVASDAALVRAQALWSAYAAVRRFERSFLGGGSMDCAVRGSEHG
jgi:hypothetical protein